MTREIGNLGALWPFTEIDAPPGLASVPMESFWDENIDLPSDVALVTSGVTPGRVPRAAYALMLQRQGAVGTISRWISSRSSWKRCATTPVPEGPDACTVLELNHILLGNIESEEALKQRVRTLLDADLRIIRIARITAMLLSVCATILLFVSIQVGLEMRSMEAFLLLFGLSAGAGLTTARIRVMARSVADHALSCVKAQFHFEDSLSQRKTTLRAACLAETLREHDQRNEVITVLGAFTLFLGFAYFIAPPLVIAAVFVVILSSIILGSGAALFGIGKALERAEIRVAYALMVFRGSSNTRFVPEALRNARRQILRDRLHRFVQLRAKASRRIGVAKLRNDIAYAASFIVIIGAYSLWNTVRGSAAATPGAQTGVDIVSIVEMAPIIVLISLSRTSHKVAELVPQILEKQDATRTRN